MKKILLSIMSALIFGGVAKAQIADTEITYQVVSDAEGNRTATVSGYLLHLNTSVPWEAVLPTYYEENGVQYALTSISPNAWKNSRVIMIYGNESWFLTEVGESACENCSYLLMVDLPYVTKVGARAFSGCRSAEISIGQVSELTEVGDFAFSWTRINGVTLSSQMTTFGMGAFSCSYLEHIDLPKSLTEIPMQAFEYTNLQDITIPAGVNHIDFWAFRGCYDLTDIYCLAEVPPTVDEYAFDSVSVENITLHVPAGCKDAYSQAEVWKDFIITEGNESSVGSIKVDDRDATVEFYNINGIRVNGDELTPGIYIKRQGAKTEKVLVK